MNNLKDLKTLHPLEIKILLKYKQDDKISSNIVVNDLNFKEGQANQGISWLKAKSLLFDDFIKDISYFELINIELFNIDKKINDYCLNKNFSLEELKNNLNIEQKIIGSRVGFLLKYGLKKNDDKTLVIEKSINFLDELDEILKKIKDNKILKSELNDKELSIILLYSSKKGKDIVFKFYEKYEAYSKFSNELNEIQKLLKENDLTGEEINQITSKMLKDGSFKNKTLRPYSLNIPPKKMLFGKRNLYSLYIEKVKDTLANLGFNEFDHDIIQDEFWNCDALFIPQFHPARTEKDVYYVKNSLQYDKIDNKVLNNVAFMHENGDEDSKGWNYKFDKNFTKRLLLRTQGTVISSRKLYELSKTKLDKPLRYFSIARCFRYDQVDATHLSDFNQTEGIVIGDNLNLRVLLSYLKVFAEELTGAKEIKYVPSYFPFTEPSLEIHIKHPKIGWMELGGAGIFRKEVTKPLGIDKTVLAWGLGIDRMALMELQSSDLRDLFSESIDIVRNKK